MRRVASELGTGASSLYRHVTNRGELLDVMIDAAASEYSFDPPGSDPIEDLICLARQQREIMHRHAWLSELAATRAPLGPNGARLLEHFLAIVNDNPDGPAAKLETFAVFNALVAAYVRYENQDPGDERERRNAAYLAHLAADGEHPAIAELFAENAASPSPTPDDGFDQLMVRALRGLTDHTP